MNRAIPWKLSRSSVAERRIIPIHYLMLDCCNGATPGKEPTTADATGLRRFIENVMLPWIENRKKELANRPLIREQAFGEALDPDKLERLAR